jgi:hypothetical protein
MMKFATLLTITTTAYGLAFDGPLPTPVQDLVNVALNGWTPRPTNEARSLPDLFRRQKANSAVCGYLNGDAGKTSPFAALMLERDILGPQSSRPPIIQLSETMMTTQPFHNFTTFQAMIPNFSLDLPSPAKT